jgi:hypothetical protein
MPNKPRKDIVIDTNIIRLYDAPADSIFKQLFKWLGEQGSLVVSQKLVAEYEGIGNKLLAGLVARLIATKRFIRVETHDIKAFTEDRRYRYTCNHEDRWHARLVFLSTRKLLVSRDNNLVNDVNGFRKINGIKPKATKSPEPDFYK